MKKVLIVILVLLLVALGTTIIVSGFKIGDFEVLGYNNLKKLDGELDSKLEEASTLTDVTYPGKLSSLTVASKQLVTTREKYQDMVAYSSEEDVRRANEIETYQVDFLFTRLGNHAKKYGLEIDLDAKLTSASGIYNLNFTVHGKYALIAEFVRAVENDQSLTFTIENFILTPETSGNTANVDTLKAEFMVPELRLDVDENISNSSTTITMESSTEKSSNTANAKNSNAIDKNTNTAGSANDFEGET